jgi:hypothetical protein
MNKTIGIILVLFILFGFNKITTKTVGSSLIIHDSLLTKSLIISDSMYIDSLSLALDGVTMIKESKEYSKDAVAFNQVYTLNNVLISSNGVRNNIDNSKFSYDTYYWLENDYSVQTHGYINPSTKEVLNLQVTQSDGIEILPIDNTFVYKGNEVFTVFDTTGSVVFRILPNGCVFINKKNKSEVPNGCIYVDGNKFLKVK